MISRQWKFIEVYRGLEANKNRAASFFYAKMNEMLIDGDKDEEEEKYFAKKDIEA